VPGSLDNKRGKGVATFCLLRSGIFFPLFSLTNPALHCRPEHELIQAVSSCVPNTYSQNSTNSQNSTLPDGSAHRYIVYSILDGGYISADVRAWELHAAAQSG
jgi:hypothetical protein